MIYADIVFFLNFISSAALLFAYGRIFTVRLSILKTIIGATASGVYAIFEIILGLPPILRIGVLLLICVLLFGKSSAFYNLIRLMLFIICLEAAFVIIMFITNKQALFGNGTVTVFANDITGGIIYAAAYPLVFLVNRIVKHASKAKKAVFAINGVKVTVNLLYDSGNLLRYNCCMTAIISFSAVSKLFCGISYQELFQEYEAVSFNTLDGSGYMPIIKPDFFTISGCEAEVYIAITERSFGKYDGIIGEI